MDTRIVRKPIIKTNNFTYSFSFYISSIKLKAEIAQSVEHQFPKLKAAGSNPVFRSFENLFKNI